MRPTSRISLLLRANLPVPLASPLLSITSNNQISQPLSFVNDANCPRGVPPPGSNQCPFGLKSKKDEQNMTTTSHDVEVLQPETSVSEPKSTSLSGTAPHSSRCVYRFSN